MLLQSEEKESYLFPKRNTPTAASLNKRNALLRLYFGGQQGIIWKSGVYHSLKLITTPRESEPYGNITQLSMLMAF